MCLCVFQVAFGQACISEQFTKTGECCSMCPAGSGLATKCGQEDTKCKPCKDGECY